MKTTATCINNNNNDDEDNYVPNFSVKMFSELCYRVGEIKI